MDKEQTEIITENARKTKKAGEILAGEILKSELGDKKVLIFGLVGELGSGKTTFIQGMAKGLGVKEKITSPTFVILKKYLVPGKRNLSLCHIDCYRIGSRDLTELDFREIISQPNNIIVLEWAERVKKVLPLDVIWMRFEYLDKDKRRIIVN